MALLIPSNFRAASLHESCIGLALTDEQADDVTLAAAIARITTRVNRWCNDTFEAVTGALDVDGRGGIILVLPQRYTAVSAVKTRDATTGVLSGAITATSYRLHSSLASGGAARIEADAKLDWLESFGTIVGGDSCWPSGTNAVQVTGTYGWTVTPPEIQRATALLVADLVLRKRGDLREAESMQAGGTLVRFIQPDPAAGIYSGIGEADEILRDFDRTLRQAVA